MRWNALRSFDPNDIYPQAGPISIAGTGATPDLARRKSVRATGRETRIQPLQGDVKVGSAEMDTVQCGQLHGTGRGNIESRGVSHSGRIGICI
jgi:hypothetical protein